MSDELENIIKKLRANKVKIGMPITCAGCVAFSVRSDEYYCMLKPFKCDDRGHPATKCPKPMTQPSLKKVKDLIADHIDDA